MKDGLVLIASVSVLGVLVNAQPGRAQRDSQFPEPSGQPGNYAPIGKTGSKGDAQAWFARYDQIRRAAQMSPKQRQEADYLLAKPIGMFMPGPDKIATKQLLSMLVEKYRAATMAMKGLELIPETEKLHKAYYQYFFSAGKLFNDYLKVQDNLLCPDPETGKPMAGQLLARKQQLEEYNQEIQALDRQARARLGIALYKY